MMVDVRAPDVRPSNHYRPSRPPRVPSTHVRPPSPTSSSSTELSGNLAAMVANNGLLFRLGRNLSSLGSGDYAERGRILKRVREVRRQNRELAKASGVLVERVERDCGINGGDAGKIARGRLREVLGVFEEALKFSMEKEWGSDRNRGGRWRGDLEMGTRWKEQARLVGGGGDGGNYGSVGSVESVVTVNGREQEQALAMRNELLVNETDLKEREAKILEIQASVNDVNAIFKDLAAMVGDQGVHIDHVQLAVGESVQSINAAKKELERTKRRNEKRRKFFFCLLLSLAAILAVVLVILLS